LSEKVGQARLDLDRRARLEYLRLAVRVDNRSSDREGNHREHHPEVLSQRVEIPADVDGENLLGGILRALLGRIFVHAVSHLVAVESLEVHRGQAGLVASIPREINQADRSEMVRDGEELASSDLGVRSRAQHERRA
jgi:hypothetical protein